VKSLRTSFLASLLGVVLSAVACGSVAPYAAKVDGTRISPRELEGELRSIAGNEQYLRLVEARQPVRGSGKGTFDSAFTALALTRQIYYVLVENELRERDLTVGPADLAAARESVVEQLQGEEVFRNFSQEYQDQLVRRQAQLDVLTIAVNGAGSPDEAARAYYEGHQDEFARACVRHILVTDQAKADQLLARLAAGEDFATVARAESKDTESAARGGELGCDVTRDTQFVPEFLLAVFSQPVGEVGQPVRTQFGFHLIKVESRGVPPFDDEVSAEVRQKLTATGQQKVLEILQEAAKNADIEIDPKYGTFNKEGESPTVVPPQGAPTVPGSQSGPSAP
jgi:hypothetical protein